MAARLRPSKKEINNSIRPNIKAVVIKMLNVSLAKTSPATKSISGSPSDCANITCQLTIIIDNINYYFRTAWCFCGGIFSQKHTKNYMYFCGGRYFCLCLITKLTLNPYASAAKYPATKRTRKITSVAENICPMSLITKLTLTQAFSFENTR